MPKFGDFNQPVWARFFALICVAKFFAVIPNSDFISSQLVFLFVQYVMRRIIPHRYNPDVCRHILLWVDR